MPRPRRLLTALTASWLLLVAPSGTEANADDDLLDLDIEDLLELDLNLNAMGVTGIHHTHIGGEWMVGYRSMFMHMDGSRNGTSHRSTQDVLAEYMVAPLDMTMQMHMLSLMYAPTDDWTYMVMLPYQRISMNHVNRAGVRFKTVSEGWGDTRLSGLYNAWRRDSEERTDRIVLKVGLSLPSGSVSQKDTTPAGYGRLPYPMQLGSGTLDLLPGVTYLGQTASWGWGSNLSATLTTHKNRHDYQLGNQGGLDVWVAHKASEWLSASLRLQGKVWGNIHGRDDRLNINMVATADPGKRAGRRVDLVLGLNLFDLTGALSGHRLTIEGGIPVYQSLDGPQLETDWRLSVGWNLTFRP